MKLKNFLSVVTIIFIITISAATALAFDNSSLSGTYQYRGLEIGFHTPDPNGGYGQVEQLAVDTGHLNFDGSGGCTFDVSSTQIDRSMQEVQVDPDFNGDVSFSNTFNIQENTSPNVDSCTYAVTPAGQVVINMPGDTLEAILANNGTLLFSGADGGPNAWSGGWSALAVPQGTGFTTETVTGTYSLRSIEISYHGLDPNGGFGINSELFADVGTWTFNGDGICSEYLDSTSITQMVMDEPVLASGSDAFSNKFNVVSNNVIETPPCSYTVSPSGLITITSGTAPDEDVFDVQLSADGNTIIAGGADIDLPGYFVGGFIAAAVKVGTGFTESSVNGNYIYGAMDKGFHSPDPNGGFGSTDEVYSARGSFTFFGDSSCVENLEELNINRHIGETQTEPTPGDYVLSNTFNIGLEQFRDQISCSYTVTDDGVVTITEGFGEDQEIFDLQLSADGQSLIAGGSDVAPGDFFGSFLAFGGQSPIALGPDSTINNLSSSMIDWPDTEYQPPAIDSYVQINGKYYVINNSGSNSPLSGLGYNYADLQECDQQNGTPFCDDGPNCTQPTYADLLTDGVTVGYNLYFWDTWPIYNPMAGSGSNGSATITYDSAGAGHIEWLTSAYDMAAYGDYVDVNGTFYFLDYVSPGGGPGGIDYTYAALQEVDPVDGTPEEWFDDTGCGCWLPQLANTSGMTDQTITFYGQTFPGSTPGPTPDCSDYVNNSNSSTIWWDDLGACTDTTNYTYAFFNGSFYFIDYAQHDGASNYYADLRDCDQSTGTPSDNPPTFPNFSSDTGNVDFYYNWPSIGGPTNPNDPIDTDGDGMSDAYEDANGLNKNDPNDKYGHLDSDGISNFDEFIAGTDPDNDADYPQPIPVSIDVLNASTSTPLPADSGPVQFRIYTAPGSSVFVSLYLDEDFSESVNGNEWPLTKELVTDDSTEPSGDFSADSNTVDSGQIEITFGAGFGMLGVGNYVALVENPDGSMYSETAFAISPGTPANFITGQVVEQDNPSTGVENALVWFVSPIPGEDDEEVITFGFTSSSGYFNLGVNSPLPLNGFIGADKNDGKAFSTDMPTVQVNMTDNVNLIDPVELAVVNDGSQVTGQLLDYFSLRPLPNVEVNIGYDRFYAFDYTSSMPFDTTVGEYALPLVTGPGEQSWVEIEQLPPGYFAALEADSGGFNDGYFIDSPAPIPPMTADFWAFPETAWFEFEVRDEYYSAAVDIVGAGVYAKRDKDDDLPWRNLSNNGITGANSKAIVGVNVGEWEIGLSFNDGIPLVDGVAREMVPMSPPPALFQTTEGNTIPVYPNAYYAEGAIEGYVFWNNGNPADDVDVIAWNDNAENNPGNNVGTVVSSARTDMNGFYRVPVLGGSNWYIKAESGSMISNLYGDDNIPQYFSSGDDTVEPIDVFFYNDPLILIGDHCNNGQQDGDETGQDTGGSCNMQPPIMTLSVAKDGDGDGLIRTVYYDGQGYTPDGNIDTTTGSYNYDYTYNQMVELEAFADPSSKITGWSEPVCGTNLTCMVTMDASKTVTATFDLFIDTDGDGVADDIDTDDDNDGVIDFNDINPLNQNVCEDTDNDGCDDCSQNPAFIPPFSLYSPDTNNDGLDSDLDGMCDLGDVCLNDLDNDIDGDGVCGDVDNCPSVANAGQEDADQDGVGDACTTVPPAAILPPASSDVGSFRFYWNSSDTPGAEYVLEYSQNASAWIPGYTGSNNYFDTPNFAPATYLFRVKATKAGLADSPWVMSSNCIVNPYALPPAAILPPANSDVGSFRFYWNTSGTPGVEYVLEYSQNASSWMPAYTGPNNYFDTPDYAPATYLFRVKATKAGLADSPWVMSSNCIVNPYALPPAAILPPANSDVGSFRFYWNTSGTPGVEYVLEYSQNASSWMPAYTGPNNYFDTPDYAPATYLFRVKATKAGLADSPWVMSSDCIVNPYALPPAAILPPANSDVGSFRFYWNTSGTPGVEYVLEYSQNASSWMPAYTGPNNYFDTPDYAPATYLFRVKATKAGLADSPWVMSSDCIVNPYALPPASIQPPANSDVGSFRFYWNTSGTPGVEYVLEYSQNASSWMPAYTGPNNYFDTPDYAPATYLFRVKATKAGLADSPWVVSNDCIVQ